MAESVNDRERAFRLISGHRALDLLATLRDRHREPTECLRRTADLDRWLQLAGFAVEAAATEADVTAAAQLRETINRVARSVLTGTEPAAADVHELNRWAVKPALAPQIGPNLSRQ